MIHWAGCLCAFMRLKAGKTPFYNWQHNGESYNATFQHATGNDQLRPDFLVGQVNLSINDGALNAGTAFDGDLCVAAGVWQ